VKTISLGQPATFVYLVIMALIAICFVTNLLVMATERAVRQGSVYVLLISPDLIAPNVILINSDLTAPPIVIHISPVAIKDCATLLETAIAAITLLVKIAVNAKIITLVPFAIFTARITQPAMGTESVQKVNYYVSASINSMDRRVTFAKRTCMVLHAL